MIGQMDIPLNQQEDEWSHSSILYEQNEFEEDFDNWSLLTQYVGPPVSPKKNR